MKIASALVVEVKEMYKNRSSVATFYISILLSSPLLPLRCFTVTISNITILLVLAVGLTKRNKPVLPARIPTTPRGHVRHRLPFQLQRSTKLKSCWEQILGSSHVIAVVQDGRG